LFCKLKPLSPQPFLQKKIPSVAKPKSFRRFIIDESAEEFHESAEEKIKTPIYFCLLQVSDFPLFRLVARMRYLPVEIGGKNLRRDVLHACLVKIYYLCGEKIY